MSQNRKSQRGRKLEEVVEDLRKEVWELKNALEEKNEEVRNVKSGLEKMEIVWKKDMEKYKKCMEGWEMEYRTKQQVVEELDKSEMEKSKMARELEFLVRRWNEYEVRVEEKDHLILSEVTKNLEMKQRLEEIEIKMVCWESAKYEETKKLEKIYLNHRPCLNKEFEKEVETENEVTCYNKEEEIIDVQEIERENELDINDGSRSRRNGKGEKRKDVGNKRILLVGDVSSRIAREFCKEEGFGAWTLPGIDINNLEKKIRKSKNAVNETPEHIVIYVGREEVNRNEPIESIIRDLTRLFKTVKEKYGSEVKVNMCKWSKYIGKYINERIGKVCEEQKIQMIKINPRWEIEDVKSQNKQGIEKAIGIAIKKSITVGQKPKENRGVFRPGVFWKKKM